MIRLAQGIEFIGKQKGSGYKDNTYLIKLPENRFISVTPLLYFTALALKSQPTEKKVLHFITSNYGKVVDGNALRFLVFEKLQPLGIVEDTATSKTNAVKDTGNAMMKLHLRFTLVPQNLTMRIAKSLKIFFTLPIMLFVFFDFLLLQYWLFVIHGMNDSLEAIFDQPFLFIGVFALLIFSTLFHEFGHAAACAFGGAKPGRIGAGIYLVWPAFFTDITDIYRLGRKERIISDIGGIYFNMLFAIILGAAYFATKFEPLLLVIALQNISIVNQLLPFVRLDGYYIVSDIVGLPDLFMRMGPIIKNVLLRQKNPVTNDLQRWVKYTVFLWIFTIIPIMVFFLLIMLFNSPHVTAMAMKSALFQMNAIQSNYQSGLSLQLAILVLQLILLLLPFFGVMMMFFMIGKQIKSLIQYLQSPIKTN